MKLANVLVVVGIMVIPSLGMAREEPAPDMEMLEFLGRFETVGGKPVDPLGFADLASKEIKKEQPDGAKKNKKRSPKPGKPDSKDHDDEK